MKMRTVALIGLGAMGSFFAPRLLEHLGAENFQVIAEGARKERLEKRGISVNGVAYRFPIRTPEEGRPVDLLLIAVKDTGLDQAIRDIRGFVGPETQILCVLNGVESEERVAAAYGWEHVLYSFMRVSIVMRDGAAQYDPRGGAVQFGEARNEILSQRVCAVRELMDFCEIPYRIPQDMIGAMWFKYACNIGENLTCALLGIPFGAFLRSESASALRLSAMREVQAVARARGIEIPEEKLLRQIETIRRIPFGNKPSTLQDIEAGKKTEIEMFAGTMVRMGREAGVPTPICQMFLWGIRVLEEKNRGVFSDSPDGAPPCERA